MSYSSLQSRRIRCRRFNGKEIAGKVKTRFGMPRARDVGVLSLEFPLRVIEFNGQEVPNGHTAVGPIVALFG